MAGRDQKKETCNPNSGACGDVEPDVAPCSSTAPETPPECPVCLQASVHPVKLPCGHMFCFLCIKGAASRTGRCALCRSDIPESYFQKPVVVTRSHPALPEAIAEASPQEYTWFYEGRNGWWEYEERSSRELERAYASQGRPSVELLIAGHLYIIHFGQMVQWRRNEPHKKRAVKRDLATAARKGVAGLILPPLVSATPNPPKSSAQNNSPATLEHAVQSLSLEPPETDV